MATEKPLDRSHRLMVKTLMHYFKEVECRGGYMALPQFIQADGTKVVFARCEVLPPTVH